MKTALQFQYLESLITDSIYTIYYSTFKMPIDTNVLIIRTGPSGISIRGYPPCAQAWNEELRNS